MSDCGEVIGCACVLCVGRQTSTVHILCEGVRAFVFVACTLYSIQLCHAEDGRLTACRISWKTG